MNPTTTAATERQNGDQNTKPMVSLAQIKRQEMEQEIIEIYTAISEENPTSSYNQRTVMVAAKTGMSPEGIKNLLKRNGITNPKKATQQ